MKKPSIPAVAGVNDPAVAALLRPMKENIELMNGVRGGQVHPLPTDASLSAVIAKINELVVKLNANG